MKITFYGHACFGIAEEQNSILIDPWFTGNPLQKSIPEGLQASLILVTHGHQDHLGDAVKIGKETNAAIVSTPEVCHYCDKQGAKTEKIHFGGTIDFEFAKVTAVPAWHSSSITVEGERIYAGNPCGFVVQFSGVTFYHAGDTCLFGDMALIADRFSLDYALLPIGDRVTMGPEDALKAVRLLRPGTIIPMHYNTWNRIAQDGEAFREAVESNTQSKCLVMAPGTTTDV